MKINESGYAAMMYDALRLRETAAKLAQYLPELMQQTGATAVAVTGKSGIALAFATLMLLDFPLIVVRKRGENSHGAPIEGTPGSVQRYLILDDFVASGDTVARIIGELEQYAEMRDELEPKCVGVLQYQCTEPIGAMPDRVLRLHQGTAEPEWHTYPLYSMPHTEG